MKKLVQVYSRALRILFSEEAAMTTSLVVAGLCVGVIQTYEPVLFGRVIDLLGKAQDAFHLLGFWAGIGILNIGASVFMAVMADRLAHRQRLNVLDEVFERAIALPVSYHSEQGSGRVVRAILSGSDQLFGLWLSFMREHLSALVGIAVLVPIAIGLDARMAGLLFGLSIIYLIANTMILKRTFRKQAIVEGFHQDLFSRVGDVIGNVTVVQSYQRLLEETKALQDIMARLLSAQYPILTWWGILTIITRISATITMVSILALGALLVSRGELSVGEVVAFTGFSGLLIGKLDQISGFLSHTISQAPALDNFFHLLDQEGAAVEKPGARAIHDVKGRVEFDNVTYRYKGSALGVFDLNFSAEPGQTIALVGPSGSGKTTTLALIQRLFDPQEGMIRIDGEDVRGFTLPSLRHAIATVFQDSGLFNRSIAENIRVGRPAATDAEVEAAAQRADAHEFILKKKNGYDFVIGERGSALSGGERQRVAIARAILKNSPILIFDEATSALDNETEKRIQLAINNLRAQQKTTFIIAHRLSTVVSADRILVFDKGRVVEDGTFQELRHQNGLFSRLVKAGELTPPERNSGHAFGFTPAPEERPHELQ